MRLYAGWYWRNWTFGVDFEFVRNGMFDVYVGPLMITVYW